LSSEYRRKLIDELMEAVRIHQNAVDAVDEAATGYLGLNRTDTRCLDIIERRGGITAGGLAGETGLTTGAITAVLDRLENAGFVERVRDSADRRRVMVALTEKTHRLVGECYGPIAEQGANLLEDYSEDQLMVVRDFMRAGYELLMEHALRIRALAASRAARADAGG
jgi:DNA-binding MarR family transcriptional regulator